MSRLPRKPLAAVVCPSAPFLAPRLLRIPSRLATATLHPSPSSSPCIADAHQSASFATKAPRPPGSSKPSKPPKARKIKITARERYYLQQRQEKFKVLEGAAALSKEYLTACRERNIPKIMEMYPTISDMVLPGRAEYPLLTRDDTRRTLQALHYHIRTDRDSAARMQQLEPFIESIVADIRKRKLPPHPAAFVHLLGIYKEGERYEQGNRFWQWLAEQDDTFVDQSVYGAAIELLAFEGKESLEALEELYGDALKRFPGTFAEYHLSPEAVLADRTAPTNIPGLPMTLLQGIMTARLLAGDWKNAYLALDTALRLYPTTVPERFIQLFMKERPLSEAYTVFLIACRAGRPLPPLRLTQLTSKLREAMITTDSQADRMQLLRAIANATYAYAETNTALNGTHISVLLNAMRFLLPYRAKDSHFTPPELEARNTIAATAHAIAALMLQSNIAEPQPLFLALISIASRLKVRALLDAIVADIENASIDLGDVGRRVVLKAAGEMRDADLVAKAWTAIVEVAEKAGNRPSERDWIAFTRAARDAGAAALVRAQLDALAHAVSPATIASVKQLLTTPETVENDYTFTMMPRAAFDAAMADVDALMRNVAAVLMAGAPLDMAQNPFSMFLDPERKLMAPLPVLRRVYDAMTVDPHQPPLAKAAAALDTEVVKSSTGVTLEELRFLNWVAVNELMLDAEKVDMEKKGVNGEAVEAVTEEMEKLGIAAEKTAGADAETTAETESDVEIEVNPEQVGQLLARIRHLRGLPEHSMIAAARGVGPRAKMRYYVKGA